MLNVLCELMFQKNDVTCTQDNTPEQDHCDHFAQKQIVFGNIFRNESNFS